MKETLNKDKERSVEIVHEYKENPHMEALWEKTFHKEYKPDVRIDFQQIKDFLVKVKWENEFREMSHYNYNIIEPEQLCDIFIQNPPKRRSISFLESLPKNIKRCVADMILELFWFEYLNRTYWTSLLFRVWHHCDPYSHKRNEKLKDFLISSNTLLHSEKEYELMEKSYYVQRRLHLKELNIMTTLLGFIMMKQLPEDIHTDDIQKYLHTHISKDFSLTAFSSRHDTPKGKEVERYRKDVDKNGNTIDRDTIKKTSMYKKSDKPKREKTWEVANRDNLDIYKDRSGETYKIYLDGPMGIWLLHNKKPVALISFSLFDQETLFIQQMQTVVADHYDRYGRTTHQGVDPIVHTIPRQKLLYDIAVLLAKKYQCKKIIIKSWENNQRINENRTEMQYDDLKEKLVEVQIDKPHLSLDIAKQIYDVFARKQKFKKNKLTKNRDKEI